MAPPERPWIDHLDGLMDEVSISFHVTPQIGQTGSCFFFLGRTRGGSVPQGPGEGKGRGWRSNPEVL